MLPNLIGSHVLSKTVVVTDVLRASTTICSALAHGARSIVPFVETDQAKSHSDSNGEKFLCGGERGGLPIGGFDLGNSPREYQREMVNGKSIAFTTTNGTKAMNYCRSSKRILIGAFCNFSRVITDLEDVADFDVVCAGTNGEITLEDCAFAGAIAEHFISNSNCETNDQALICKKLWQSARTNLLSNLRASTGGQNLIRLQKDEDIEFSARIDTTDVLPTLQTESWKIEPA